MFEKLVYNLKALHCFELISEQRKRLLQPLVDYIQDRVNQSAVVNLNFICTHNSRRSHLAQVWSQVAAAYYYIPKVYSYSGGTEETAVYPKIIETLLSQGFEITKTTETANPVYEIQFAENEPAILAFSKRYDDAFNPKMNFAAVMTCSQADEGCPLVIGADKRISITYQDPKVADNTASQNQVYEQRSQQIAAEMLYVFSQVKVMPQ